MESKTVRVTQVRSAIGSTKRTQATLASLGLGRIGKSKDHVWTESTAGMARRVSHLVELGGVDSSAARSGKASKSAKKKQ